MKSIKNFFVRAWAWTKLHKKTSIALAIVLAGGVYWYAHSSAAAETTRYVYAKAAKTTISSTVSGSGQVAALDQVEIQSEVSGDIQSVRVKVGDTVAKGAVIATIDSKDAVKAVSNAEISLANAQISLAKAQKQYGNQSATSTVSDISKAYQDGYTVIQDAFIDMPAVFLEVGALFYDPSHSPYFSDNQLHLNSTAQAIAYKYQAGVQFDKAKAEYDANFSRYKAISANSSQTDIVALLDTSTDILNDLSAALSGAYSTIDYINSIYPGTAPAQLATDKAQLSSFLGKINSDITSVSNTQTSIEDAKDSGTTAEISLKTAELSLSQAQENLDDANQALYDHTIRAPFDGLVAKVPVEVGDKASNNSDIATIVTDKKIVTISLNEIDAAKVKVGQKAKLTFDAIDGLDVDGTVTEVDLVGTVAQGVVSYSMKISLDTADARIKVGMTTSVGIAVESKEDVIAVPTSSITTKSGKSSVLVSDGSGGVTAQQVTLGLVSDDMTEITSGLTEGESYVARTITVTATTAATANTGFSLLGGGAAGRTQTGATRTGTARTNGSFTTGSASGGTVQVQQFRAQ